MSNIETAIKFVAVGTAASLAGTTALAQGADFEGGYAGLGFGTFSGVLGDDDETYGVANTALNIFGGYNFVNGDYIFGGEAALWSNSIYGDGNDIYGLEGLIDLKARVGYAFGNTMFYGSLGYSFTTYFFEDDPYYASGFLYGAGFETSLTEKMFVGADITFRDFAGDDDEGKISRRNIGSVAVRAGFRF